ncbi:MAG: hypothetical protein U9R39_03935 [Campylobacterota bacterium]|nr:hypothetical protein [Campylobacterota bacterium]
MEPLQMTNINASSINIINPERLVDNNAKIELEKDSAKLNLNTQIVTDAQSTFSNKLTNSINTVSNLQNMQSNIDNQINIVNEINFNIQSSNAPELLDAVQPKIKSLMDNFNTNSKQVDLNQLILDQESADSTAYFDGILGSKPLSPSDIMEATQNKMMMLESMKSTTNNSFDEAVNEVKNTISKEKQISQENSPFKEINFEKESSDFTSNNINNTIGSIATSQANPSTSHTVRLLAL